ncbi:hypothetical protein DP939_31700 [Spongiactinospora rosea]|uniref:ATP-grasp domain-containing protein n=1 Tax=Spongiactinospora rosea TaxID=2248750 RepID=A0A366LRN0_9ACTN|nr:STM4014 family protein [Spongiactinospora rosea]RBQ16183.1 hypothetical protein DP939_31700 [Spongiactinospora rosea]
MTVFAVVGTPGDRRVRLFADALRAFGLAEPTVIAWRDVLTGAPIHIPEGAWVRIDSPGEDPATDALLRGPGPPTRVGGGASWYAGFLHGLERVRHAVSHTPGARLLADIDEIATMFDKRRCHTHLSAAAIPVPPALGPGPITGYPHLRKAMTQAGWHRVFIKPPHGSSAAGIVALQTQGPHLHATTPIELLPSHPTPSAVATALTAAPAATAPAIPAPSAVAAPAATATVPAVPIALIAPVAVTATVSTGVAGSTAVTATAAAPTAASTVNTAGAAPTVPAVPEMHNSLRVRTYTDEADVAAIIDALAPDGLHVERWFPKASIDGRVFDLRVVVIGGRPTHAVVRASRTPMTNLHLGGTRGDLEHVRARLGPDRWERAMLTCARAAACFPNSPMVGVDLMVGIDWRRFAVAEVNAFGDLLPGLTGLPDGAAPGLDCHAAQVAHLLATGGGPA